MFSPGMFAHTLVSAADVDFSCRCISEGDKHQLTYFMHCYILLLSSKKSEAHQGTHFNSIRRSIAVFTSPILVSFYSLLHYSFNLIRLFLLLLLLLRNSYYKLDNLPLSTTRDISTLLEPTPFKEASPGSILRSGQGTKAIGRVSMLLLHP